MVRTVAVAAEALLSDGLLSRSEPLGVSGRGLEPSQRPGGRGPGPGLGKAQG